MYVGLWSRLEALERDALTHALERKTVIEATLMRATIHLVSRRDYWPLQRAIENAQRRWWLRVHRGAEERRVSQSAKRVRAFLAEGPRRWKEVEELLGRDQSLGVSAWLPLVRVPPSGTWERRRADLYGLAEDWLGPSRATETEGLEHLVRRYLSGFGPASIKDMASWAGLPVAKLRPVTERLPLRRFRDERGSELLDVRGAPLPDPETPAPVRFLPTWEATLLVHARRTQILPEPYRPLVFDTKTPHSVPTFLVDGAVAGKWRYEGGRVRLEPFDPLLQRVRREVEDEADRLAAFHRD
jgi:Winged helix DNA-binding domain